MRNYGSFVLALTLLTACGDHDRPPVASDYGANGAFITVAGGGGAAENAGSAVESETPAPDTSTPSSCTPRTCAEQGFSCGTLDDGCGGTEECGECTNGLTCSDGGGGTCASVGMVCKTENMKLLGSCVAYDDANLFAMGADCEEFYDSTPGATTAKLSYACDCAHGIWATGQTCSARAGSHDCMIRSAAASCSRTVSCFSK